MVDLSQLLSSLHSFEPIGARYSQLCDFEILSGLNFIFSISRCQIKFEQTALNVYCLNVQLLLKACFLDYFSPVISLYFGSCIAQEISLYIFTHMHIHVHMCVCTHICIILHIFWVRIFLPQVLLCCGRMRFECHSRLPLQIL